MKTITSAEFEQEVKQSDKPVIVDFQASWCGPCRVMKPVLEEMSNNEAFKVVCIDVDDSPDLASEYEVFAIPTLLIFKNGVVAERFQGIQKKDNLLESVLRQ